MGVKHERRRGFGRGGAERTCPSSSRKREKKVVGRFEGEGGGFKHEGEVRRGEVSKEGRRRGLGGEGGGYNPAPSNVTILCGRRIDLPVRICALPVTLCDLLDLLKSAEQSSLAAEFPLCCRSCVWPCACGRVATGVCVCVRQNRQNQNWHNWQELARTGKNWQNWQELARTGKNWQELARTGTTGTTGTTGKNWQEPARTSRTGRTGITGRSGRTGRAGSSAILSVSSALAHF